MENLDKLKEIGRENSEIMKSIANTFIEQAPQLLENIKSNLEGNTQALHDAAHTLKGVCLNLGAHDMAELALKIEQNSNDSTQAKDTYKELTEAWEETQEEIAEL